MIPNFAGCPACSPLLKFLAGDLLRKRCLFVVPPLRRGGDQPGDECKLSVEHIPAVHEPLAERPQIAVGHRVARDNPDCSYFLSRRVQDGFGARSKFCMHEIECCKLPIKRLGARTKSRRHEIECHIPSISLHTVHEQLLHARHRVLHAPDLGSWRPAAGRRVRPAPRSSPEEFPGPSAPGLVPE